MAREEFIDNLRQASRLLPPPVVSGQGAKLDFYFGSILHAADLWLTPRAVAGFDRQDFADCTAKDQERLEAGVAAFLDLASRVQPDKPTPKAISSQARRHLQDLIKIVGDRLRNEWLEAQEQMVEEATAAAKENSWFVGKDEKEVHETLLGTYRAPRLRIRTPVKEVVLDPIARFGSGRQGVVDLVVLPTYETAYYVTFKEGRWHIDSAVGSHRRKPLNRKTLVNAVNVVNKVPDR